MNGNGPAIEIRELSKVYSDIFGKDKVRALDGISFEVNRGEIFGFLGPNGAGKTTTIHILMNFIFSTGGEARVLGLPVSDYRCRTKVGFLPELFSFDKFLKGQRLMEYLGLLSGVPRTEIPAKAQRLLKWLDMEAGLERKVRTYSKGMTQKIGLAQALVGDPDLLILDEPTSGMDPIAKAKVKNLLLELKAQGKTTFLSTHILSDVEQIADRVAIINKGKLITVDTLDNLLKGSDLTDIRFVLEGEALKQFSTVWQSVPKTDAVRQVSVSGKVEKAKALAHLVELGAEIVSVNPKSMGLEEIFMQLVDNGNSGNQHSQQP